MTTRTRNIVLGLCALAVLAAVVAYLATGSRAYTRFRDKQIEADNAESGLDDLFADSGINDEQGDVEKVESAFGVGLLPSGPGAASLSVATVGGVAGVVGFGAWFIHRRASRNAQEISE